MKRTVPQSATPYHPAQPIRMYWTATNKKLLGAPGLTTRSKILLGAFSLLYWKPFEPRAAFLIGAPYATGTCLWRIVTLNLSLIVTWAILCIHIQEATRVEAITTSSKKLLVTRRIGVTFHTLQVL